MRSARSGYVALFSHLFTHAMAETLTNDGQLFGVVMDACVYVYTCMSCAATPPFFAFSVQVEYSLSTASFEPFSVALMPEGALSILHHVCELLLINIDHACSLLRPRSFVYACASIVFRRSLLHRNTSRCCTYLFVLSSLNIILIVLTRAFMELSKKMRGTHNIWLVQHRALTTACPDLAVTTFARPCTI
jgi:hypothetical protein